MKKDRPTFGRTIDISFEDNMTIYAGRPVQYLTTLFAILTIFVTICFWVFIDTVGFNNLPFDYSLGSVLVILTITQSIAAVNFWKFPTLVIEADRIRLQKFPVGQKYIARKSIKKVTQAWLSLSPMVEITFENNGQLARTVIAAESKKQNDILKELNR